jgi:PKD repeat protein
MLHLLGLSKLSFCADSFRQSSASSKYLQAGCAIMLIAVLLILTSTPVMSAMPFTHVVIDPAPPAQTHCKAVGDIDGDGFSDALVAGAHGASGEGFYWYEYPTWTKHTIVPPGTGFTTDMQIGDVDNDGDIDAIIPKGFTKGSSVWWYENPRPAGDPATDVWNEHYIGDAPSHDIEVGDVNNDGKLDVVVRHNETTLFLQNNPTSWTKVTLSTRPQEGTALGDIDKDGDVDVATGGYWLENPMPAGDPAFGPWTEHTIDSNWPDQASIHLADINQDGRMDAIIGPAETDNERLSWYAGPSDPKTGNWIEHVIDNSASYLHTFKSADMDRDGDFDIIGVNWHGETPFEMWRNDLNPKRTLNSWERHVVDSDRPWVSLLIDAADLDGDNLADIVTGGWWYRNPGSPAGGWIRNTIGDPLNNMAAVYDFDRDGDTDILGTQGIGTESNPALAWARNSGLGSFTIMTNIEDGSGTFLQGATAGALQNNGVPQTVLSFHNSASSVQRIIVPDNPSTDIWMWEELSPASQNEDLSHGDIDRDGDSDLLLGTQWLRNDGASWNLFTLNGTPGEPDRNRLADINRDGRLDAVVGFESVAKLAWYEQGAAATDTWTEHIIADISKPMSLDVADMDSDGDFDVVVGEHNLQNPQNARLYVFENADGQGFVWDEHIIYTGDEHHDGAQVVDIDNDGDLDIISMGFGHSKILLYENKSPSGGGGSGNRAPVARFMAAPAYGPAPLLVNFNAWASFDADDDELAYSWDFGDGSAWIDGPQVSHLYSSPGIYSMHLMVSDGQETSSKATLIAVGPLPGPTGGLIHFWPLDEKVGDTATDLGGPKDGSLHGPIWKSHDGILAGALEFDGSDDYVDLESIDITGNGMTLALWIKADNFNVFDARFISKAAGVHDADHYWMLSTIDETAIRFRLKTGGITSVLATGPGEIVAGRWCHIAATYDGSAMRIFKDGVELAARAKSGELDTDPTVPVALGNQPPGGGNRPFDGHLDDVRIYNRALTASELSELAKLHLTGADNTIPRPGGFELHANFPNPFNPSTTIRFTVPAEAGHVKIAVYDVHGRLVNTLLDAPQTAGLKILRWDGKNLNGQDVASGLYFCRMTSGNFAQIRKMVLIR